MDLGHLYAVYIMSINNITLSDILVSEWYGADALIPSANPAALRPESQPAPQPISQPASASQTPPQPAASQPTPPVTAKPAPVTQPEPSVQPTPPSATTTPTATTPSEPASYKLLGNHRRKVTIIVDSPGSAFLPDDQLGFLSKILEACRMNIGDVAIVNHHTLPVTINTLRGQLQPENIILFGVDPTAIRLPINFPAFKLQPYDNCTYLYAPSLQQMVGNTPDAKLLKSKLWVCLKTLFDV